MPTATRGRPRDDSIDERVLDVTRRHLAAHGYEAMSVASIAREAGTTRQALYRRWDDKADLATAAIASLPAAAPCPVTSDPFEDLVAELESFRAGISRSGGVSTIGTMLLSSTDAVLVELFRERVVAPRRRRLLAAMERARAEGLLDADADLQVAVSMLTGSWYARVLAGDDVPARWARRAASLVWRACGGEPRPVQSRPVQSR